MGYLFTERPSSFYKKMSELRSSHFEKLISVLLFDISCTQEKIDTDFLVCSEPVSAKQVHINHDPWLRPK